MTEGTEISPLFLVKLRLFKISGTTIHCESVRSATPFKRLLMCMSIRGLFGEPSMDGPYLTMLGTFNDNVSMLAHDDRELDLAAERVLEKELPLTASAVELAMARGLEQVRGDVGGSGGALPPPNIAKPESSAAESRSAQLQVIPATIPVLRFRPDSDTTGTMTISECAGFPERRVRMPIRWFDLLRQLEVGGQLRMERADPRRDVLKRIAKRAREESWGFSVTCSKKRWSTAPFRIDEVVEPINTQNQPSNG